MNKLTLPNGITVSGNDVVEYHEGHLWLQHPTVWDEEVKSSKVMHTRLTFSVQRGGQLEVELIKPLKSEFTERASLRRVHVFVKATQFRVKITQNGAVTIVSVLTKDK